MTMHNTIPFGFSMPWSWNTYLHETKWNECGRDNSGCCKPWSLDPTAHRLCFSAQTRLLLCQSFFLLLASVAFQPQLPPSLRLLLSLLSASSRVLHRISATNPFNMANPPLASHHTAQSCFPCSTPPIYCFFLVRTRYSCNAMQYLRQSLRFSQLLF
jgi:hypothetical protein